MALSFEGRVAIVTGAGRGIGRYVALGLAKRGAQVLVNDFGGGLDTLTSGDPSVATAVADEIEALGGKAVPDSTAVGASHAAAAIAANAMKAFGRIDILVNNAGGFGGTEGLAADTDDQLDAVLRSNLLGGYHLLRQVWPTMTTQRYGRVVNMISGALLGMPGTAAYSTAKGGMIGLTNVAASEGRSARICVNGVWPIANTRMADEIKDDAMRAGMVKFPPNLAAEAIIYLCSEENTTSGEMFTAGGGSVARTAFCTGKGFVDPELTAESLAANIDRARDLTNSTFSG